MSRGILLEVEGRTGVVLTPKGEFRRIPLPQGSFDVGEEIAYKEGGQSSRWGWLVAAAAALLLLLSPAGYQQWALAQPLALVMIDINPSIQLSLNGREQVIDAQGLNADGQEVLDGLPWQKRPFDEVTRAITARAVAAGMLDPAGEASTVVVAVAPVAERELSDQQASAITAASKMAVQAEVKVQAEAKGQEPRAQVAALEATYEEVREAMEQGITLPKLIILQELQAERPELDIEALKDQPPGQILKELGVSPGDLFGKAEEHRKGGKKPKAAPVNSDGRGTPVEGEDPDASGDEDEDRNDKGNTGRGNDDRVPPGQEKRNEESDSPDSGRPEEEENGKGNSGKPDDRVPPGQVKKNEANDARESEKDAGKAGQESEKDSRGSGKGSDESDRGSGQSDRGSGESDEDAGESAQDSPDSPRPDDSAGDGKEKDGSKEKTGPRENDNSKEKGNPDPKGGKGRD